jgi:hypothetical protein
MGIAGLPLSPSKTGRQFTDDVGLSGTTVNFSHVSSFGHAQFEPPPHQHGIQHKRWWATSSPHAAARPPSAHARGDQSRASSSCATVVG